MRNTSLPGMFGHRWGLKSQVQPGVVWTLVRSQASTLHRWVAESNAVRQRNGPYSSMSAVVTAQSYTGISSKNVTYKSEVRFYVLAYQFLLYAVFEYT